MPPMFLSVVIPAYNSSGFILKNIEHLSSTLSQVLSTGQSFEILVVDDGSTDNTATLVESAAHPNVRLIRHAQNQGKGAAVRTGMLEATGTYRIFIDADLPIDLSALPKMLDYLDRKEFHIVVGTRDPNGPDARRRPPIRRVASWIFTEIVSRIVVTGIRDTQCGFKGFRGDAAEKLFSELHTTGFAFDVEVLYRAFKADMDIKRIPVTLLLTDSSTVSLWRHGSGMFWTVLQLPFRYHLSRLLASRGGHTTTSE